MAKRKRLTPAKIGTPSHDGESSGVLDGLETKSTFPRSDGVYKTPRRAPIADVAHDVAATAALTTLSHEISEARRQGRWVLDLPLAVVDESYLVRDRIVVNDDDMAALTESLRIRGQQTAIEVADLGDGRFGLISGWRRLMALRQLQVDQASIETVLAIIRTPKDSAEAYLAMVEENEIRAGLSYYERARIVTCAADQGVYDNDKAALAGLFASASRPKRSKIGSFIRIVRALDGVLSFPVEMGERLGLALSRALDFDVELGPRLTMILKTENPKTADAEQALVKDTITLVRDISEATVEIYPSGLRCAPRGNGMLLTGDVLKDPEFRDRLTGLLRNFT